MTPPTLTTTPITAPTTDPEITTTSATHAAPARSGEVRVRLRPRSGVSITADLEKAADGSALVVSYDSSPIFRLNNVRPAVVATLRRATHEPVPMTAYDNGLDELDARQWVAIVERLGGALVRSVAIDDHEVVAIESLAPGSSYSSATLANDTPVRLGKFSYLRRRDGRLVLESPVTKLRAVLSDDAGGAIVAALAHGTTALESARLEFGVDAVRQVLEHLVGAGFADAAVTTPEGYRFATDSDDVLRQWDFHDLLFHSRSRMGRTDEPYGGRFPYVGEIEPLPAVKPAPASGGIPLHRPKLEDIQAHDPTLVAAMEARQSVRSYGSRPITIEQLGTFLYRVARVRGTYGPRPGKGMPYEGSSRPYPCGGAGYELELYLTVQRCEGLAPGAYWYDPLGHRLFLVNDDPDDVESLIAIARTSTGGTADPDLLITMASRFQRISWKYQSIAYSVTLKHAGVLYQTMYLVATAMGLAPCGLGSGDSDLAGRVLGLDYLKESAVGEFILGSLPDRVTAPETAGPQPDWRPANDPSWQIDVLPRRA